MAETLAWAFDAAARFAELAALAAWDAAACWLVAACWALCAADVTETDTLVAASRMAEASTGSVVAVMNQSECVPAPPVAVTRTESSPDQGS